MKKVKTVALNGMEGRLVEIETDISQSLPCFIIIGLADASVKEASDRVKRAIINSDFGYPKGKITVNLSPAYLHKKGSHFDLGIAIGILLAQDKISCNIENILFIGELSLDGKVVPAKGVLPMIMPIIESNKDNIKEIILPEANCEECYLLTKETNVKLIPVKTLREAVSHLEGNRIDFYEDNQTPSYKVQDSSLDFCDVKGQMAAKDAVMTAVAGGHNLLMIGSPGSGKTMIAKRISTILPEMSLREQLESTKIYSYAGQLNEEMPIINKRPFRYVTVGTTKVALVGGGNHPSPGEISYAHNGVLFMDEMFEFPEAIIEALRVPLEEKKINIIRKGECTTFLSDFIFVGATNPCRCGFLGDKIHPCTCTQTEINRYRSKLSGPIADRIDIAIEVNRIDYDELSYKDEFSTEKMRGEIYRVKEIQKDRYKGIPCNSNGELPDKYIDEFCVLDKEGKSFMENIYNKYGLSPRRYFKLLKVARTVADLKDSKEISAAHLAIAFHYTRFFMERKGRE